MAGSDSEDGRAAPEGGQRNGILDHILAMAEPSHVCGSQEMPRLARFAMATREFLRERAHRLIRRAQGMAVLYWYSNDTTPMVTRKTFKAVVGGYSTWH